MITLTKAEYWMVCIFITSCGIAIGYCASLVIGDLLK